MGSFDDLFEDQPSNKQVAETVKKVVHGGGGFLDNLVGGFEDLGLGIASLAFNAAKDAGSAIGYGVETTADILTPGNRRQAIDDRYNFATDDFAKNLAFDWSTDDKPFNERILPVVGAITEPYGFNIAKGDITPSLKMSLEHAKDDPVQVLMDALSAVSLGGSTVAQGAKFAGRFPAVEEGLTALARGADAAEVGRTANLVDKVLPGLKYQKVGEAVPYGGTRTVLDQGGRPREFDMPTNPVRRFYQDRKLDLRTTDAESHLTAKVAEIQAQIDSAITGTPVTTLRAEMDHYQGLLNRARNEGLTEILKPRASEKLVGKVVGKLVNENSSVFVSLRNKLASAHREILHRLDNSELTRFTETALGFREEAGGRVGYDNLVASLDTLDNPRIAEVVAPHVERVNQIQQMVADPAQLANSQVGELTYTRFIDHLKDTTDLRARLSAAPPGTSYRDLLTPEEATALQQAVESAGQYELEAARRYVEIVGGEPAAGATSDMAAAMDDTRLLNLETEAKVVLENGGTYTELFDRLYQPLRVKQAFEEGVPLAEVPTALELDNARKAAGIKAPAYYPQHSTLHHTRAAHLQTRKLRGAGKSSNIPNLRRNEGVLTKQFLEGTKDAFIHDPNEAYARLAAHIANHEQTARLIDAIKNEAGVRITAKDQVPPGYVVMNPDSLRVMNRLDMDTKLEASRLLKEGADPQDAFARGFRETWTLKDADLDDILARRKEIYAVPKFVADEIEAAAGLSWGKLEPKVRVFHDSYMNAFRASNLYLRPGFYINNVGGNAVFLKMQGGKLSHYLRQLNGKYRAATKRVVAELGAADAVEGGMWETAAFRNTHWGPALDDPGVTGSLARGAERFQTSAAGRVAHKPIDWGQRLNGALEDGARRESFLTAAERDMAKRGAKRVGSRWVRSQKQLDNIMQYGMDNPKVVAKWIDDTNGTMNNYRAASAVERKLLRRFVAPFWSFYKHSAKTVLKMPIEHPGKAELLNAIALMDQDINGDRDAGFLDQAYAVGAGNQEGTTRYLALHALNPFGGVTQENPIGQLSPVIKTGLETALAQDLYTGQPFDSPNAVTPFGSETAYRMGPNGPEPTDVRPMNPFSEGIGSMFNYFASQFAPYRLGQSLLGEGSRYDTGQTKVDPATGEAKYPTDKSLALLRYLGVPLYDINAEEYAQREAEERRKALGPLLQQLLGQ